MENDTNASNVLPTDFDGIFRFTNYTEKDFTAKWNSVEYTFPAMKTSPMIIPNATPEEVQSIRKLFARKLAEAVFYQSNEFKAMDLSVADSQAGKIPALYTDKDIAPYVQCALEPLPIAQVKITPAKPEVINTRTDDKGKPVSKVLEGSESLVGDGQVVA